MTVLDNYVRYQHILQAILIKKTAVISIYQLKLVVLKSEK
jgi:hypothetical protein